MTGTDRDVALLLACAQEYEDSALACDTPSLRRFRRERRRKADALRKLANRLMLPPAAPAPKSELPGCIHGWPPCVADDPSACSDEGRAERRAGLTPWMRGALAVFDRATTPATTGTGTGDPLCPPLSSAEGVS